MDRFAFPTMIHFGAGARRLVADHLKAQGVARPLIVTDRGIAPLPLLADFVAALPDLDVAVYSEIWGNPVRSHVNLGVDAFKAHRADAEVNRRRKAESLDRHSGPFVNLEEQRFQMISK